jgi:hypothetical protein
LGIPSEEQHEEKSTLIPIFSAWVSTQETITRKMTSNGEWDDDDYYEETVHESEEFGRVSNWS